MNFKKILLIIVAINCLMGQAFGAKRKAAKTSYDEAVGAAAQVTPDQEQFQASRKKIINFDPKKYPRLTASRCNQAMWVSFCLKNITPEWHTELKQELLLLLQDSDVHLDNIQQTCINDALQQFSQPKDTHENQAAVASQQEINLLYAHMPPDRRTARLNLLDAAMAGDANTGNIDLQGLLAQAHRVEWTSNNVQARALAAERAAQANQQAQWQPLPAENQRPNPSAAAAMAPQTDTQHEPEENVLDTLIDVDASKYPRLAKLPAQTLRNYCNLCEQESKIFFKLRKEYGTQSNYAKLAYKQFQQTCKETITALQNRNDEVAMRFKTVFADLLTKYEPEQNNDKCKKPIVDENVNPVHQAIKSGDIDKLKTLMQAGNVDLDDASNFATKIDCRPALAVIADYRSTRDKEERRKKHEQQVRAATERKQRIEQEEQRQARERKMAYEQQAQAQAQTQALAQQAKEKQKDVKGQAKEEIKNLGRQYQELVAQLGAADQDTAAQEISAACQKQLEALKAKMAALKGRNEYGKNPQFIKLCTDVDNALKATKNGNLQRFAAQPLLRQAVLRSSKSEAEGYEGQAAAAAAEAKQPNRPAVNTDGMNYDERVLAYHGNNKQRRAAQRATAARMAAAQAPAQEQFHPAAQAAAPQEQAVEPIPTEGLQGLGEHLWAYDGQPGADYQLILAEQRNQQIHRQGAAAAQEQKEDAVDVEPQPGEPGFEDQVEGQ